MTETSESIVNRIFRKEALSFPAYSLSETVGAVRLHQNESHSLSSSDREELAALFADALCAAGSISQYPSLASDRLVTAYAQSLGVLNKNIEVTAGSSQALTLIAEAFFGIGRRVAITHPSFSLYANLVRLYSAQVELLDLDDSFEFRKENIFREEVLGADAIILCSPNNPTGTLCERDLILELANRCRGILIVDEAYIEFADDAAQQSFIAEAVRRPNVIVLRTLSKAWAAAGLRVGCIVAHEDVIRVMRALKPPYSITWPSELIASHFLETKQEHTQKATHEVKLQRDALSILLRQCRHVSFVSHSQANFVFFVTQKADVLERVFNDSGFLIRRYHGGRLANAVRISMPPASEFEKIRDILVQNLN